MRASKRTTSMRAALLGGMLAFATLDQAQGIVQPQIAAALPADRAFISPELEARPAPSTLAGVPGNRRRRVAGALEELGVDAARALLDPASGRWVMLRQALPLIPGTGVGNRLEWRASELTAPDDADAVMLAARGRLLDYLRRQATFLQINPGELELRSGVANGGDLVQFSGSRFVDGLPVRGARFTAVINHGNLVLIGVERWGDINVSLQPALSAEQALTAVGVFAYPAQLAAATERAELALVAAFEPGEGAFGEGYEHRLVWVVRTEFVVSPGRWEALVDAHTGRLLALQDLNHYGTARNVKGGVYPAADDGVPPDGSMVSGYPMPFADLSSGGFADAGGNFSAAGEVTTTLDGQFVTIEDDCGPIDESSTGDVDLAGSDGDDNCDVPPGHSAGDTAGARTAYYELNRLREGAISHLPGNAWLASQLTAITNLKATCGASWNGSQVVFFRQGSPCANTAQIAGVVDHEWGHGLDDNDVDGSIPGESQGGGEGMGDLVAALRHNVPCVGRGFRTDGGLCSGYGDPCTPESGCTGVRTVDWAERVSGVPHDLTWMQTCGCCTSPQCRGAIYAEAVWDLFKRDLPATYGMDDNTALEVTTQLFVLGNNNLSGWFDTAGSPGDAACGASQAYLQFLAVDDDDGDIDNGTPHMTAIAAAFDRHEIGCTPGGAIPGPVVQDSGCVPTPASPPVVTAGATDTGADLSWTAVADAAEYRIYRTDGERQCALGKALVGTTAGTTFADSGLQNGRPYSYIVIPFGAGGASCFGPASDCATVGATTIFDDGFESGDTSAWDGSVR